MSSPSTLLSAYSTLWREPRRRDTCALLYKDQTLTYGELYEKVAIHAGQLRRLGVTRGMRVALAMERSLDSVISFLGVLAAGACPCPLEPQLNPQEITHRLRAASIETVLFDQAHRDAVASADAKHAISHESLPGADPYWDDNVSAADSGLLLFTSGSTGRPKGVLISHRGLLNNAMGVQEMTRLHSGDRLLHMMPLYHTNGLNNQLLTPLLAGAQVALTDRFRAANVSGWMVRFRPTVITGVPTMYSRLLEHDIPEIALSSLRFARCGSAPITPELHEKIEKHLKCPLVVSYGLSEATCTSTMNPPDARKVGSIGKPLPHQKVFLRTADGSKVETPLTSGEICIEGDSLMIGYVGVETEGELTPQPPLLATGDLGHFDGDGYFFITGRLKDVIIRGGENLSPGIIEKAVNSLHGVKSSCVLGQPHYDLGEVPVAFVVPEPGMTLTPEMVRQHVAGKLTRVYWPDKVYVVESLPENSIGKVDKKTLKTWIPALEQESS